MNHCELHSTSTHFLLCCFNIYFCLNCQTRKNSKEQGHVGSHSQSGTISSVAIFITWTELTLMKIAANVTVSIFFVWQKFTQFKVNETPCRSEIQFEKTFSSYKFTVERGNLLKTNDYHLHLNSHSHSHSYFIVLCSRFNLLQTTKWKFVPFHISYLLFAFNFATNWPQIPNVYFHGHIASRDVAMSSCTMGHETGWVINAIVFYR